MINVEIKKKEGESTSSTLRRFSKRFQSSGVLRRKRATRYTDRIPNKNRVKKTRLALIEKIDAIEKLIKLGKAPMPRGRRF